MHYFNISSHLCRPLVAAGGTALKLGVHSDPRGVEEEITKGAESK